MFKSNLFIIGAPKCGTTTLFEWFETHSDVFCPDVKEPHFFYTPYGYCDFDKNGYNKLFDNTDDYIYRIDSSVFYFNSRDAITSIVNNTINPKFIFCIRNPYDMAISLHAQKVFTGHELEYDFQKALNLSDERMNGSNNLIYGIDSCDTTHMSYKYICSLGLHLELLISCVGRDNIEVVVMDDLILNPDNTWFNLLNFLNLKKINLENHGNYNPATTRKSITLHHFFMYLHKIKKSILPNYRFGVLRRLNSFNTKEYKYKKDYKDFEGFYEHFDEEISKLEIILDRDFSSWKLNAGL